LLLNSQVNFLAALRFFIKYDLENKEITKKYD